MKFIDPIQSFFRAEARQLEEALRPVVTDATKDLADACIAIERSPPFAEANTEILAESLSRDTYELSMVNLLFTSLGVVGFADVELELRRNLTHARELHAHLRHFPVYCNTLVEVVRSIKKDAIKSRVITPGYDKYKDETYRSATLRQYFTGELLSKLGLPVESWVRYQVWRATAADSLYRKLTSVPAVVELMDDQMRNSLQVQGLLLSDAARDQIEHRKEEFSSFHTCVDNYYKARRQQLQS